MGIIDTRLVNKPAFKAVGLEILWVPEEAKPSENQLAKIWEKFNPRSCEIPHAVPGVAYGLERFEPGFKPGDPIRYMACVEVTELGGIPEGMSVAEIPGATYVAASYQGTIDGINSVYSHIWGSWLPQSKYEVAGGWNFEYYGELFRGNDDPESVYEVWFPVRAKQE